MILVLLLFCFCLFYKQGFGLKALLIQNIVDKDIEKGLGANLTGKNELYFSSFLEYQFIMNLHTSYFTLQAEDRV